MKLAILALVLGGCMQDYQSDPYPGPGPDPGYGCSSDTQCGSAVCASNGECVAAGEITTAHVTWTLRGAPASATTCTNAPDLELHFAGDGQGFGFAPVPCVEGKFTVTKLPIWFTKVFLYRVGDDNLGTIGFIDPATGNVALDLNY